VSLFIFLIVFVASLILQVLPALSVLAGCQQDQVLAVVQVVKRITRLRPNAIYIAFTLSTIKALSN